MPCGTIGLAKVRNIQDGNSMNSMTTVLPTGQIRLCLVVIARQSGSSLTLPVGRLTTSDSLSTVSLYVFFIFYLEDFSNIMVVFEMKGEKIIPNSVSLYANVSQCI